MRILLGYNYYQYPRDVKEWVEGWLNRLKSSGFDITAFPLTLNPPGSCLYWNELDYFWKTGNKELFRKYEELAEKLTDFDVFINWNGINMHPRFVEQLSTYKVFAFFDDPESSEILSKPVAACYDLCLVGNIAEIETYKSWGVKNVEFWPHGFRKTEYDPHLTYEKILNQKREYPLSLICERESHYRKDRLEKYYKAFPTGEYFGEGWPNGFLEDSKKVNLYQKTKIGINIHNSTGPINFRTYELPANGVMQICDNKSYLGKIFKLEQEVIGYDTIEEAIELTKYYLNNEDERIKIAANGWKRAITDYNEVAVFKRIVGYISDYRSKCLPKREYSEESIIMFLRKKRIRSLLFKYITKLLKKLSLYGFKFNLL